MPSIPGASRELKQVALQIRRAPEESGAFLDGEVEPLSRLERGERLPPPAA